MAKAKSRTTKDETANGVRIRRIKRYGWLPDLPDHRDFLYAAPAPFQGAIPAHVDLSKQCPPVYDQEALGSCTANAIAAAIEFDQIKSREAEFTPSRLFIYYNERAIEGTVDTDAGAQIRDGIKCVATQGAAPETDWPYVISKFSAKPPAKVYADARRHVVKLYQRLIQEPSTLKGCLASGYPFVFGFTCYESFEGAEVAKTGVLDLPASGEKSIGGHAVLCVGYDDRARTFLVRNSWGPKWGRKGYFTMPYSYLTDHRLASDLWTIRSVQ